MVFWIKDRSTNEASHRNNQTCLRSHRDRLVSKSWSTSHCLQYFFFLLRSHTGVSLDELEFIRRKVSYVMKIVKWDLLTSCGQKHRASHLTIELHISSFWCLSRVLMWQKRVCFISGGRWKPWEDRIGIKLYGCCLGKASEIRHPPTQATVDGEGEGLEYCWSLPDLGWDLFNSKLCSTQTLFSRHFLFRRNLILDIN